MGLIKRNMDTTIISPAQWDGEGNCRVGPFSSRDVAHYFATQVVNIGNYDVRSGKIVAERDEWFVETLGHPASQGVNG